MLLLRFFMTAALAVSSLLAAPPASAEKIAHVTITDSDLDDPRRWGELRSWLDQAITQGATGVIFDINVTQSDARTALPQAEEVARRKIKTIAFINSSAIGGGALLALGCDEIWMAPGSRIGAAPPRVHVDEALPAKAQDTLLAEALAVLKGGARSLCKLKGHRSEIGEAFVDREKGMAMGTTTLAEKGELLLLDADTATQNFGGTALLARGVARDLQTLLHDAAPKASLITLNADWYETQRTQEKPPQLAQTNAGANEASPVQGKLPVISRSQDYRGKVVVIPVGEEDLLIPARFEFMRRTLSLCNTQKAEAVIFDLDTPGGLAWETITLMMKDLQHLHPRSFAFVNTRAISAGALIAMATDTIYMAPASAIGASTPVSGDGTPLAEAERAKTNSAIMGMARTVVREKGHDVRIIEGMIDMERGLIINGQVIIPKGEIVTLDSAQATMLIEGKPLLAKGIAKSIEEIKNREHLKGDTVIAEPTGFEMIAIWVTRYAAVLILIGLAGGYLEMQSPGFGIPGFVAVCAFALFFFGHYVAGSLAGKETLVVSAVFLLGLILLGVELLAAPGTIVPGVLGFIGVMIALVYAMSGWESAAPPANDTGFHLGNYAEGLRNFALGTCGAILLIALLAFWLPALRPFRALVLQTSVGGTLDDAPVMQAATLAREGDSGVTRSAMRPFGTVEIGGRLLEAVTEGEYLQSGITVRVHEVRGEKIIVRAV